MSPKDGNSGFTYTPSGETVKTFQNAQPVNIRPVPARRTNRWERTSLDLSTREVISVGSGREEIEVEFRYVKNVRDLLHMLTEGANGVDLNYKPYLDGSMSFPLQLVGVGDDLSLSPDPGRWTFGEYGVRVRFRDASASGAGLEAMYSPWWYKYSGGMKRGGDMTFTRATTAFQDSNLGVLTSVASGGLRDGHWVEREDGILVPSTLLEGARVNKFTQPEDLTHGDWTQTAVTVTADQAGDPKGGTTLDEIIESTAASAAHFVYQDHTVTADANYAESFWCIAGARTWVRLQMFDPAATANLVRAWFNLSTGVVGTTAAGGTGALVRAYVEDWTDVVAGLYRCVLVGSVGNSATTIRAIAALATGDANVTYTGDGTSSLYAGFAMLEDNANFASSYHDGTRNADALSDTVNFTPADIVAAGGLTVYSEWIERGTAFGATGNRYIHIGGPGNGDDPRLTIQSDANNGRLIGIFDDGTTLASSASSTGALALFDHVRARMVVFLDGSTWKAQLHFSVNGGAETSAAAASIGSDLPGEWSANTLTIGDTPDGLGPGFAAHIAHMALPGVVSLADATAWARQ